MSGDEAKRQSKLSLDLLSFILIAAIAAMTLAAGLRELPVQIWDEARLAINALEMRNSGNWLVPTFHGEIDLWNLKPPLATWLAALSMDILGINELALRLPSLLAAILTTFAVFLFTRRVSNDRVAAMLAAVVLLGTGGFVEVHVARTADPDSLLVLFLTLTAFALFFALEKLGGRRGRKWLFLSAAAFSCAILTKGAAALLMVPGYALAIVVAGKPKALVSTPAAWASAGLVVATGALYCAAAEAVHPGYLAAVWNFDVVGRLASVSDEHSGPIYYYLRELLRPWQYSTFNGLRDTLFTASALPWSMAVPLLAPLVVRSNDGRIRGAAIFCLAILIGFVLTLSAAATKLPWYVAPAFPLIAVVFALEVRELASRWPRYSSAVMAAAFAAAFVCVGFAVAKNREEAASANYSPDERLSAFVRDLPRQLTARRSVAVISDARWDVPSIRGGRFEGREMYDGPVEFTVAATRALGENIRIVRTAPEAAGDDLLVGCGLGPIPARAVVLRRGACEAVRAVG